jgi:predicted amino acid dehydrogenase
LVQPNESTRAAFLIHFPEPKDLKIWEPRLQSFSDEDCVRILDATRGLLNPFVLDNASMRSPLGPSVDLILFGVPFTAEQAMASLRKGDDWAADMVKSAVDMAKESGCTIVGCGGHTSIVTDDCQSIFDDRLVLTSGNSLTVAAAYEACKLAALEVGFDFGKCRLGIVGAAGNLGLVLGKLASTEVGELLLIGRPGAERFLYKLREEFGDCTSVLCSSSIDALRTCDIVVAASNSPRPIIYPEHIRDGPCVICDVAVPQDVSSETALQRPQAKLIRGGRVIAPLNQSLSIPSIGLNGPELYGCLAETLVLGFAGRDCPVSVGRLSTSGVRRIAELAALHGFQIHLAES